MSQSAAPQFNGPKSQVMAKSEVRQKIKAPTQNKPEPRNDRQRAFIDALWGGKSLTVVEGPAGTGKTYIPAVVGAYKLSRGDIKSIVVTSPCVGAGNSLGFRKGDVFEKMQGWVAPITDTLSEIFGKEVVRGMFDHDILKLIPFEDLRGRSFDDSIIIADECQNLTPAQMQLFLTRSQEGSQTVVMGDLGQIDIKGTSGLQDLKERLAENPNSGLVEMVRFLPEDVVRSELCKYAVGIYSQESPTGP